MLLRAWIYDRAVVRMTRGWYEAVLARVPASSRLLDVGIGTGAALAAHGPRVKELGLRVLGVDIDADYVRRCAVRMRQDGLSEQVQVKLESVYDLAETGFDAVYFSGSFMLMPDPVAALTHVLGLLAPGGRVYFTQTFERDRSATMEWCKPLLKRITTIDFGAVSYRGDFLAALREGGVEIVEEVALGRQGRRCAWLVVAQPISAPPEARSADVAG